jgi:hypothetical protein
VPKSHGVEILTVRRRSWLLPPRVVQPTTVDWVKAEIVDQAEHRVPGVQWMSGDRESDPPHGSRRRSFLEKTVRENVVEGLKHRVSELLRDPLALEQAAVDCIDAAVAKLRVVVAGIDHDDAAVCFRKKPAWESGDGFCRNRDDHDVSGSGGLEDGRGRRTDLGR